MTAKDELPLALRTAYLIMHRRSDAAFAQHDITADQFVLLASLARGQAMTQRELAARMPSDPSTVRAMLVLLEKQGLITRTTHPTDSRARTVSLTEAGAKKFKAAWEAGQPVRDQLVEALSDGEAQALLSLLRRVAESLGSQSPELAFDTTTTSKPTPTKSLTTH
ncbi:MAG: MarR family transcriptional regulator [Pirellulales bacterium]